MPVAVAAADSFDRQEHSARIANFLGNELFEVRTFEGCSEENLRRVEFPSGILAFHTAPKKTSVV